MKLKQIRVDGYKNLINCVVDLGDFNVVVGPNNSGKSNLLEAVQMLSGICFGGPDVREEILLRGGTPGGRGGLSICHLDQHQGKPITIGIKFEQEVGTTLLTRTLWVADYDIQIRSGSPKSRPGPIVRETLKAKPPGRSGPATKYISRGQKQFEIALRTGGKKNHKVATDNTALAALSSLYPEPKELPVELVEFRNTLYRFARTPIFALSPSRLRHEMDEDAPIKGLWVSSFDLGLAMDQIKQKGEHYRLFTESLSNIMGLETVHLHAMEKKTPGKQADSNAVKRRMRYVVLKRPGDRPSLIEEYSDGTLLVAAVLAALLSKQRERPILCLEELETCLHPAALEKLVRFLQDHSDKWPVLITTHSPVVLNAVNPEDVNVAIVDGTGASHFEKMRNTKQLRDYLKSGLMSFGDLLPSNFADVLGK